MSHPTRFEGNMDATIVPCIVSVDWLHKKVESREDDHLAVLDTTWFSDKDAIEGFSK